MPIKRRRSAIAPAGSPGASDPRPRCHNRAALRKCLEAFLLGPSPDRLADCFNEFVFVGELARLELGIELLAAHGKLEAASCRGNHDETTDRALVTRQELGRQTDGLRLVVSKCTVFERDIHGGSPSPVCRPPAIPSRLAASCSSVIINFSHHVDVTGYQNASFPERQTPERLGNSLSASRDVAVAKTSLPSRGVEHR